MRKIIYETPDGKVCVVTPVINTKENITEAAAEERAMKRIPADAIAPQFVDDVPKDREFRNAWKRQGHQIMVDEEKARKIKEEKERKA